MSRKYVIEGGRYLKGEIKIRGAKNAITKEIVASMLASGKTVLENIPDIGDVSLTTQILEDLGCVVNHEKQAGTLSVNTKNIKKYSVPFEYSGINRIPILMAGPLLHKFGQAVIPMMGGCDIGPRPLDFHISGLEKLGTKVVFDGKSYHFSADKLIGTKIELPFPSVGATENIIMAAVLARGVTVIKNAAIEPEIVDLVMMLQSMGAIISQEVDRTWVIQGVERLNPVQHRVINDRIEAASFAVSAIATRGDVTIKGADQLHLQTFLNWLRKAGGEFEVLSDGIRFYGKDAVIAPIAAETAVHPGLMTDWQQPLVILLTQASGVSVLHETVYENRFSYVNALNKMGAKIQLFKECLGGRQCRFLYSGHLHSCVITGPTPLTGAEIEIPDLRAGFSYLVAAVMAQGRSSLSNIRYIERGYDRILEKFRALGVNIEVEED
ncbi:MAG: UDP-N-acetylglucosamine 1-carboxyvinyltransferase [Fibrobacteria bacterium]|nr:UDP-N-acetylglucosamine 1-carboxyvinyltransferase [Fibrobacteria bacterium]